MAGRGACTPKQGHPSARKACSAGRQRSPNQARQQHRRVGLLHYGPGDVRLAHGPDESVEIDEVVRVTEALVLSTLRACGTLD